MNIKLRLTVVSFLQFFVWGAWLITIATYFFSNNMGTGVQFGAIFSTLALSSLFMPAITGIVADRWIDAEKLYGVLPTRISIARIAFYLALKNTWLNPRVLRVFVNSPKKCSVIANSTPLNNKRYYG